MPYTLDSPLNEFLSTEKGRAVMARYAPRLIGYPFLSDGSRVALRQICRELPAVIEIKAADAIVRAMNRPITDLFPEVARNPSLDHIERKSYGAGPSPMAGRFRRVALENHPCDHPDGPSVLSLDGDWQLAENGQELERLKGEWKDAISARVPGSVHSALVQAGRIPDPTFAVNQKIARLESFKTWWMSKRFSRPRGMHKAQLMFGGVCNGCEVWLNGKHLGSHEGMFGGPDFDVTEVLQEENLLVVRIDPIPFEAANGFPSGEYPENNASWKNTVVFNNVYGWHYSNLQSLGIWRSVELQEQPLVKLMHPFIATHDAAHGIVDLLIPLQGSHGGWPGKLNVSVSPENFTGEAWSLEHRLSRRTKELRLRFQIPQPRLWWPVDLGEPNLYRLKLSYTPINGGTPDTYGCTFGIRTIGMAPLPDGPRTDKHDWTFVINGKPRFVKGSGWCTMDALMDFRAERYERFLELARQQHIQMLRAWGSGMPETDEFYDTCDRKGIMIFQEWPTAWNSHKTQPYSMLEETTRRNTLRLRNHAALVMWCGGNESRSPLGKAIDMMGRLSIELDGTRPFHRSEPWGGSHHNYDCYWGRQHLDRSFSLTADFFGEFGLASMPVLESVNRYLPPEERDRFPPKPDGALAYHTPIFGMADDISRLSQFARYFVPKDCSLADFVTGSQLAQALGVRHVLELARVRWPECSGALYYKMNDNFPAASWACVDWYGAPKIGHYLFQDSFAPLHAVVLFRSINLQGASSRLPIFLLDDSDSLALSKWRVIVRVYDAKLREIVRQEFADSGSIESPLPLGECELSWEQAEAAPLFVVTEVLREGTLADRTFYWLNFQTSPGCLFRLPRTSLSLSINKGQSGGECTVANVGDVPAIGVALAAPGHLDSFTASDNYFWLDPGEKQMVAVNRMEGLTVNAWNA
jgi:beta-mannosidase